MYKAKLWDEDKLSITKGYGSHNYGSIFSEDHDKKEKDFGYNEQKYGSGESGSSSDYMRKHEEKEKDEEKSSGIFEGLEEEKKESKELKEDEIPFKAASQIFVENREKHKKTDPKKDSRSSIDEAIKKAIEEEKNVIILDS